MYRAFTLLLSALLLPALAACEAAIGEEAAALVAPGEVPVRVARHCPHCGWIESKREILPEVADPLVARIYEYTLRRANGSLSVFRETLPTTWRLGERVVVIDGTDPKN
jgi:hypothetical protein